MAHDGKEKTLSAFCPMSQYETIIQQTVKYVKSEIEFWLVSNDGHFCTTPYIDVLYREHQ